MADLSFTYDQTKTYADISVSGGDFVLLNDLETAVGISLFTDRRATDQEIKEFQYGIIERQSRRGYWANTYRNVTQGSGLWLLDRSKRQEVVRSNAEVYAASALQWLVDEGIAASVDVSAEFFGASGLDLSVSITKPTGEDLEYKYQFVWG